MSSSKKKEPVCLHAEADNIGTQVPVYLSDLSVHSGW